MSDKKVSEEAVEDLGEKIYIEIEDDESEEEVKEETEVIEEEVEEKTEEKTTEVDEEETMVVKKEDLKKIKTKFEEMEERYLRALAEMRDLHKDYQKQNQRNTFYIKQDIMLDLLPLLDVFNVVLSNKDVPTEVANYLKGFELVLHQFNQMLESYDVSEIVTNEGDEFDYNIHNAMESVVTDDKKKVNKINQVLQKGFMIEDRVLRPVGVNVFVQEEIEEEDPKIAQEVQEEDLEKDQESKKATKPARKRKTKKSLKNKGGE